VSSSVLAIGSGSAVRLAILRKVGLSVEISAQERGFVGELSVHAKSISVAEVTVR